jgi:hypothetical protein
MEMMSPDSLLRHVVYLMSEKKRLPGTWPDVETELIVLRKTG